MLVDTPQIVWHGGEAGKNAPILSIDTHPLMLSASSDSTVEGGSAGSRLVIATAGTDAEVRLWLVSKPTAKDAANFEQTDMSGRLQSFVGSLTGHQRGVNVVRFSPDGLSLASASDGGAVVIWSVQELTAWSTVESDRDTTKTFLCGATEDIYDMAWSPDSSYIVCGSIDRRTHIWEVATTRLIKTVQHHTSYVQGAAWDPLAKYMATQSSDRSCRVYDIMVQDEGSGSSGAGRLSLKIGHVIKSCVITPEEGESRRVRESSAVGEYAPAVVGAETIRESTTRKETTWNLSRSIEANEAGGRTCYHVSGGFHSNAMGETGCGKNENVSPIDVDNAKDKTRPLQRKPGLFFVDETVTSFFRRLSWSPDGAFLITPTAQHWDVDTQKMQFCTYLFTRGQFSKPAVCLPGLNKPSVAVRCNPRLFALQGRSDGTNNGSRGAPISDLPYRAVFAVVSLDAIVVYDTEHSHPLTVATGLHYSGLTDACWSSDGLSLFVSSTDGYVSKIHFEEEELGVTIPESEVPWQTRRLHPVIYGWQQEAIHVAQTGGRIPTMNTPCPGLGRQASTSPKVADCDSGKESFTPFHPEATTFKRVEPTSNSGHHGPGKAGAIASSTAVPLSPTLPSTERKKRRITPTLLHNSSGSHANRIPGSNDGEGINVVAKETNGTSSSSTAEEDCSRNLLPTANGMLESGQDRTQKKKRLTPTLVSTL